MKFFGFFFSDEYLATVWVFYFASNAYKYMYNIMTIVELFEFRKEGKICVAFYYWIIKKWNEL